MIVDTSTTKAVIFVTPYNAISEISTIITTMEVSQKCITEQKETVSASNINCADSRRRSARNKQKNNRDVIKK